jgi:hypothetical protein
MDRTAPLISFNFIIDATGSYHDLDDSGCEIRSVQGVLHGRVFRPE